MKNIESLDDFINEEYQIEFELEGFDFMIEKARPPKLRKKQREANTVKSKITRELLGPNSKFRPLINKLFKQFEKEVKKEAIKQGVPPTKIKLDKLTIKR